MFEKFATRETSVKCFYLKVWWTWALLKLQKSVHSCYLCSFHLSLTFQEIKTNFYRKFGSFENDNFEIKASRTFFSMKFVHLFFLLDSFGSWNATVFNAMYSKTSAKTLFILQQWTHSSRSLIEIFKLGEKNFSWVLYSKKDPSDTTTLMKKKNFFTSIEERKKNGIRSNVFVLVIFLPIFPFQNKNVFFKISHRREQMRMMWGKCFFSVFLPCARVKWREMFRANVYIHQYSCDSQAAAKAEGKEKEKQHKMLYTILHVDCSRNIRLCTFATLKKCFL